MKSHPKPKSTEHLRTLANGAIYDMNRKRIVANPGGGSKAFTSETAGLAVELRTQKKRELLARAANAVAMQGGGVDGRELHGDFAFVEAIGEAMTMKALSVNDPKAVDAARFVFTEAGLSERQQEAATGGNDPLHDIGALFVEYMRRTIQPADVIDIRNDNESNDE